jgi:hypothetical protein
MCDSCSFKPNGEGEEGNDHDGLDMEDHVDRVGQAHVGLLHYQLGQRPPYTGQEAEKKTVLEKRFLVFYCVREAFSSV